MRRHLMFVVMAMSVLLSAAPALAQQDASLLAGYGYPEVVIEVSDSGVLLPGTVTAGRTLLTYRNTGSDSRHAFLARLPDELPIGDLFAEGDPEAPPAWLLQSSYPGFPGEVQPGEETQVVVDLTPGLYLVVEDFSGVLTVLPGDPSAATAVADPAADATIALFEYDFDIPDNLAAGNQVWKVVNAGREPHELLVVSVPDGSTEETVLDAVMNGTGDAVAVGGMGWLSPGVSAWTEIDLAPGTYAALCFVFDPATGHAPRHERHDRGLHGAVSQQFAPVPEAVRLARTAPDTQRCRARRPVAKGTTQTLLPGAPAQIGIAILIPADARCIAGSRRYLRASAQGPAVRRHTGWTPWLALSGRAHRRSCNHRPRCPRNS